MKTFVAAIVLALFLVLIQTSPTAEARECEQQVNALEHEVQVLQSRIAQLTKDSSHEQTRRTTTGAVFTRVNPVHSDFGESWLDPSGMIWGDAVKNADGSLRHLSQYQATEYCQSRGGLLPSREDFIRLREYMGARPGAPDFTIPDGYVPQVLPNLTRSENGQTLSSHFWSSSVHSDENRLAYDFDGLRGIIDLDYRDGYEVEAFRCVASRSLGQHE